MSSCAALLTSLRAWSILEWLTEREAILSNRREYSGGSSIDGVQHCTLFNLGRALNLGGESSTVLDQKYLSQDIYPNSTAMIGGARCLFITTVISPAYDNYKCLRQSFRDHKFKIGSTISCIRLVGS